mgnify:CR=1 FL=1
MTNNKDNVFFFDLNGKLVKEKIEGKSFLSFIYKNPVGRFFRRILNKPFVSKINGFFQKKFFSKYKIKSFIKKHNIDTLEFEKKIDEFKSFNDFFTRKLKPGCRLIDQKNNSNIISPADSKLFVVPKISSNLKFFVKGCEFNLEKFLNDKKLAQEYEDGSILVFRLAPYDYHRFHFPFNCLPSRPKIINGLYDSVNPLIFNKNVKPLTENERQIITLKSNVFSNVLMVIIGAMMVGKIKLTYDPNKKQQKGDECGFFEFGASSIALLFKKDEIKIESKFIQNSLHGFETAVKMGQVVASKL